LDVRATQINEAMKRLLCTPLQSRQRNSSGEVNLAYNKRNIAFGKEYIIPNPLTLASFNTVAPSCCETAMESGLAQKKITDWEAIQARAHHRMGIDNKLIRTITQKAKTKPKRVRFAESDHYKILKAAHGGGR